MSEWRSSSHFGEVVVAAAGRGFVADALVVAVGTGTVDPPGVRGAAPGTVMRRQRDQYSLIGVGGGREFAGL